MVFAHTIPRHAVITLSKILPASQLFLAERCKLINDAFEKLWRHSFNRSGHHGCTRAHFTSHVTGIGSFYVVNHRMRAAITFEQSFKFCPGEIFTCAESFFKIAYFCIKFDIDHLCLVSFVHLFNDFSLFFQDFFNQFTNRAPAPRML